MKLWLVEADLSTAEGLTIKNRKELLYTYIEPHFNGERINEWVEIKL